MSIVAVGKTLLVSKYGLNSLPQILYESIPHTVASLLTHTIATGWAAFQIAQTANFRADFSRLVTNGACKPTNLLPKYWTTRRNLEISTLALNIAALLISTFLTWRLIKVCPSVGMH